MDRVSKRFYTINDLVEMGCTSLVTIWKRIKSGELPAIKVGRSVRIPAGSFEEYCESPRVDNGSVSQWRPRTSTTPHARTLPHSGLSLPQKATYAQPTEPRQVRDRPRPGFAAD